MRLTIFLAEYKRNWLIATIGIILYAVGFAVLSINEGETKHSSSYKPTIHKITKLFRPIISS